MPKRRLFPERHGELQFIQTTAVFEGSHTEVPAGPVLQCFFSPRCCESQTFFGRCVLDLIFCAERGKWSQCLAESLWSAGDKSQCLNGFGVDIHAVVADTFQH